MSACKDLDMCNHLCMSACKDLNMCNESIQTKAMLSSIQITSHLPLVAFDVATMN